MKIPCSLFILLFAFAACTKEQNEQNASLVVLTKDAAAYEVVASNRSSVSSDPFDLKSIEYKDGSVQVSVGYPGGCKKHSFEFIWSGAINKTNPPGINLVIQHHANGDACEAYRTETLTFALAELLQGATYPDVNVTVMNGGDPVDSVVYKGNETEIRFTESDTCNVLVTASAAVCGYGLYGNLWFALDDSIRAGAGDYYFHKYLQPVAISSSLQGFVPVAGKRYKIGARIDRGDYFPNAIMCLAYSGPSVPVKILCIEAVK